VATSALDRSVFSRTSRQFFSGLAAVALFGYAASSFPASAPADAQVETGALYGPPFEIVLATINADLPAGNSDAVPMVDQAPTVEATPVAVAGAIALNSVPETVPSMEAAPAVAMEAASEVAKAPTASVRQQIPYQAIILEAAQKHGLPPEFLAAALDRESAGFKERYVRGWHVDGTGRGIAGIDKKYHPEVSDEQAFDPHYSINWMATELGKLHRKHGNTYDASREYNGGPNFASSRIGYGGQTVNELTARHAEAIKELSNKYRPAFWG
jgi:soluble lytic murein transglycosylase-like protein